MKKILKILGFLLSAVIAAAAILVIYVKTALPDVGPPPEITVESSPELVARGAYLANSVSLCMDCHAERNWQRFSGPPVPGTRGKGGEKFTQDFGFPGRYISKNITSFGIGGWTDGELYRAITTGVSKDGRPLFPVMPYLNYGRMAPEDIKAIIAYLRTLEPMENTIEESTSDFPMNLIINTIPSPADPQPRPDQGDVLAYGAYMTNAAGCGECHTPQDMGTPVEGMEFAGGFEFRMPPFGTVRSANLTPHQTGLANWTEEQFVNRFKMYADSSYVAHEVGAGEFQTVMPWMMYATMEETDLKAIYAYLRTLTPVENVVVKFEPASAM